MTKPTLISIGLDAKRIVANATGLGAYGRNLVNALASEPGRYRFILYAPDAGRNDLRSQVRESERVGFAYSGCRWRLAKDRWRAAGVVDDARRAGVRLYHGLSGELPAGLQRAGIRSLMTVHDLIFMRHPEYYKPVDVWLYKRKFHRSLHEADRIVAISECTKRDILFYSDFPEDRIDVVYQGCDTRFREPVGEGKMREVAARYGLPPRYVLNVGTVEERKNVLLAVKALPQLEADVCLVVVGRRTRYADTVWQWVARHGLTSRVLFLEGVPNSDLPAIYRRASAFVYPSRYEGFGIPIIEAIQSGLPVVAAKGSCLEEAGGPDCCYVDPDDSGAMAAALNGILSTDQQQRVERAKNYVRRFENSNVAQQILQEYDRIIHDS